MAYDWPDEDYGKATRPSSGFLESEAGAEPVLGGEARLTTQPPESAAAREHAKVFSET